MVRYTRFELVISALRTRRLGRLPNTAWWRGRVMLPQKPAYETGKATSPSPRHVYGTPSRTRTYNFGLEHRYGSDPVGAWWSCRELNPRSLLAGKPRRSLHNPKMVRTTGFEPVMTCLKNKCLWPLGDARIWWARRVTISRHSA